MFGGFSGSEIISLLGVLGGAFLAIGKAIQWYISRFDARTQKALQTESDLRRAIEKAFEDRIRALETESEVQRRIIDDMNKERQLYLRRIYQLEALAHQNKLEDPSMEGWPP